jgi:hypothetical protein
VEVRVKSDEDRLFTAFRGGAFLADLNMRPVFNPKFWNQWKVVETGSSKKVVELTSMGG